MKISASLKKEKKPENGAQDPPPRDPQNDKKTPSLFLLFLTSKKLKNRRQKDPIPLTPTQRRPSAGLAGRLGVTLPKAES